MASLKEAARALHAAEEPLLPQYRELRARASSRAEQALAAALYEAQRAQVGHLQLLCEELPSQFAAVGVVSSDAVKLRQGPGGTHPQLAELRAGTPVIVIEWSGYWAHVQVPGGRRGFVFRDYVRTEGSGRDEPAWQR
jgi:uncharacterized protein YgiM (DUF1202 family)